MGGVRATPAAVLLQFEPIAGVRPALHRDVVPPLALLAGEGDRRSLVGWHVVNLFRCRRPDPGRREAAGPDV